MSEFKRLSVDEANAMISKQATTLADMRDESYYKQSHIPGAVHLDNTSVQEFIETADPDKPLIIYCYHGNSSLSAAQFLCEKGFDDVYSMDGGFEAWRQQYPVS